MVQQEFQFPIQTDNGTEFTYKNISETEQRPFEITLQGVGIEHILVQPRIPWHNGKVERSHRTDQRYFYEWEKYFNVVEHNKKIAEHLEWSNNFSKTSIYTAEFKKEEKCFFPLTSKRNITIIFKHRGVAQMVARMVRDHEAAGSSPATPTMRSVLIAFEKL